MLLAIATTHRPDLGYLVAKRQDRVADLLD
jgi:hypothetical protein